MQSRVLSPIDHPYSGAELLDDAGVRDGLAESYVCGMGKSMKAVELAVAKQGSPKDYEGSSRLGEGSSSERCLFLILRCW